MMHSVLVKRRCKIYTARVRNLLVAISLSFCVLVLQTPSGDIITESTDFQQNQFILLLPNPVESGQYTCEVPQLYADEACLGADSHHKNKASVVVDGVCNSLLGCLHLHVSVYMYQFTCINSVSRCTRGM